jgi:hypothetical protein
VRRASELSGLFSGTSPNAPLHRVVDPFCDEARLMLAFEPGRRRGAGQTPKRDRGGKMPR